MTDQRDETFSIPDEIVVTLKKPLKFKDRSFDRLTFRPPTVGEMKKVEERTKSQGEASAGILMLSLLNNEKLSPVEIEHLNFIDMQIAVEQLKPFLELAPRSEAPKD